MSLKNFFSIICQTLANLFQIVWPLKCENNLFIGILIKGIWKKILTLLRESNTWLYWLLVMLSITLAFLIADFFGIIISNVSIWFSTSIQSNQQKIWEIIGISFVLAILFLNYKRFNKNRIIEIFLFFLLGFIVVKYWSIFCQKNSFCDIQQRLAPNDILNFINIIQTIAIILIAIILCLFYRWLSSSSGIIFQPFDIQKDNTEDNLPDGKSIADLLAAELHRIYHIHNLIGDGKLKIRPSSSLMAVCREDINFPLGIIKEENLENTLASMGTISLANNISLPIGSLLLVLKQLWPQGTVQIITGTIQKHGSTLQLTARFQQTNHQSEVHVYKVIQEFQKTSQILDMVQELAYRIALDLSPKAIPTCSWEAFHLFTEALSCIWNYERTKSLDKLNEAYKICIKAIEKDKNYKILGDLLSVISFYYLSVDNYYQAISVIQQALEISPNSPYVHAIYGHTYYYQGDYEKALIYYERAKELKPERHEIYIRIGIVEAIVNGNHYTYSRNNFLKSKLLECENHGVDSALAWLDFLCCLDALKDDKDSKVSSTKFNSVYKSLKYMRDKTHIDYSNFAIVLLYKKFLSSQKNAHNENLKKRHINWLQAFHSCSNETMSDRIKRIFFELLVVSSEPSKSIDEKKIEQIITRIDGALKYQTTRPQALINDLLKDAKIIWFYFIYDGIRNNNYNHVKKELINDILSKDKLKEELSRIISSDTERKKAIDKAEEDLRDTDLYMYKSIKKFIEALEKYRQIP